MNAQRILGPDFAILALCHSDVFIVIHSRSGLGETSDHIAIDCEIRPECAAQEPCAAYDYLPLLNIRRTTLNGDVSQPRLSVQHVMIEVMVSGEHMNAIQWDIRPDMREHWCPANFWLVAEVSREDQPIEAAPKIHIVARKGITVECHSKLTR